MSERKKCEIVNEIVEPCISLDKAWVDSQNGRGLHFRQLTNMRTLKPSKAFVELRSGQFEKRGIVVNYCPFCGAQISRHMLDKSESANA